MNIIMICLIGLFFLSQTIIPFFWPLKYVYFFGFRPKAQKEYEEMIKEIKDYVERRNEFFTKVEQLEHDDT